MMQLVCGGRLFETGYMRTNGVALVQETPSYPPVMSVEHDSLLWGREYNVTNLILAFTNL